MAMVRSLSEGCRQYLRSLRVRAGLSQNKAARLAGIDPAHLNGAEKHGKAMSREIFLALAVAYGCTESQRDHLLFLAGYAPVLDYQEMFALLREELSERLHRMVDDVYDHAVERARRAAGDADPQG